MRNVFWVIDLLLPATLLALGWYYYAKKSHMPLSLYSGLRTSATTQGQKQWQYAHRFGGRLMIVFGAVLTVFVVAIKLLAPLPAEWLSLINVGLSLVLFILATAITSFKASRL